MTQPQAQQVDHAARERVDAVKLLLREAKPGTVFVIGFGHRTSALWLLVANNRYELTILNLETGAVVANKLDLFAEMTGRREDGMWMKPWE